MKKKFSIPLIIAVVILIGLLWARWRPAERFDADTPKQDVLRVVTWNVGYFAITKNKNMRDVDIEEVSQTLKTTAAQIVLLQELGKLNQADKIAQQMGKDWKAYSVETGHGQQVVSILTPLTVIFQENVSCGGRMSKGISLTAPNGKQVYILGVHSPHPARGITENEESISSAITHTRLRDEKIRIVGGDLNYNFKVDAEGELYTDIMKDFGDGTISIGKTYYAHTRIDHFFHYPKGLDVIEEESGMLDLDFRLAKVPGFRDHRPIVVSYKFK